MIPKKNKTFVLLLNNSEIIISLLFLDDFTAINLKSCIDSFYRHFLHTNIKGSFIPMSFRLKREKQLSHANNKHSFMYYFNVKDEHLYILFICRRYFNIISILYKKIDI